jgi:hypothetical protein
MGQIDVTDLLTDSDFVDDLVLIHRVDTVGENGRLTLTERNVPTIGSIQPASGKTLQRLPEAFRVESVSSFWLRGEIVSDGSCKYPDIICYRGQRYAVQTVMDWTNWGAGWCEGTCVREKPTL